MSQQDLDEKPFRLSFKRSWEKIMESLELDTLETNEGTEKTCESDTNTLQSIRGKECELQRFLDETDRRLSGERDDLERMLKEVKGEAESLREKVIDLENALLEETEKGKRYFKVIEMLERDNERLEEENIKLRDMYRLMNEKLCGAERQIEMARQDSILKMLGRGRKNTEFAPEDKFEDKLTAKVCGKRVRTGTEPPKEREKASKTEETEIKRELRDGYKSKRSYADELWIKKFKFLKQKLVSEQKRSRNLEFLISTQKELLEAANKNIYKLKAEKRLAETNQEKMNGELCALNELRLKEKSKIDNVITFCDLISNSSFSEEELAEKLTKVPLIISSFLKGATDTMVFENTERTSVKLISSVEKHEILKHLENCSSKSEDNSTARELEGIRSTLNNIAETLVQATPSADPSVLTNLDKISHVHLTLEECLTTESHAIMNPNFVYKGKNESDIFKRAVKNSHNMLWNIQAKGRNSTGDSSEYKSEAGSIEYLEGK